MQFEPGTVMKWVILLVFTSWLAAAAGCSAASPVAGEALAELDQVMVFKPTGAKQCATAKPTYTLRNEQQRLAEAGVTVLVAQCAHDGLMRPAVCGAASGDLWLMAMTVDSLATAQSLGYQAVAPSDDFPIQQCR